jgi:hypothetical protein
MNVESEDEQFHLLLLASSQLRYKERKMRISLFNNNNNNKLFFK